MKRLLIALAAVGALTAMALVVAAGEGPTGADAASHREAPLIAEDPSADNTDLYAFRAHDSPNKLTIISNWNPAEDPAAGPNYYKFSSTAKYNIKIDKTGDGYPELVYSFRFKDRPGVFFLGNTVQDYKVVRDTYKNGNHKSHKVLAKGVTPPANIGPRSTPDYRSLAAAGVFRLKNGGKVFAGQRDDPFFGDIGAIFDLVAIRRSLGAEGGGKDFFAGYAVHSIALQIPISQIDPKNHIVGVWSTTERPELRAKRASKKNDYVPVSRIGNPLVNEVIIPTKLKDRWNRSKPANEGEFKTYYKRPILAQVLNTLYPGVFNAPETNRNDLVQVFLTGVPGLNKTGDKKVEMLRINLSIPPTPPADVNRLGVLGGDLAGWPNGRRLEDDVIDIAERAVAGALVGNAIEVGDGVDQDSVSPLATFPYAPDPFGGYANSKGDCENGREEVAGQIANCP